MITDMQQESRKVVKVDPPKAGYYHLHFDDGTSKLVARVTGKLKMIPKDALKWWAADIEHERVVLEAVEVHARVSHTNEVFHDALRRGLRDTWNEKKKKWEGKKAHQMRLKEAGDIGTSLHKGIQAYLRSYMGEKDVELELEGPALLAYMAWEDWADSISIEPTHVETMLGSERMDVGGTMDCAGWVNNELLSRPKRFHCIFDWKSSKRSQTAPNGIYPEAEIQVSVYRAMAIEMGMADDDSWAAVVRLPKNEDDPCLAKGSPEPFDVNWIDPERATYLADGFLHIGKAFSFMAEAFPK